MLERFRARAAAIGVRRRFWTELALAGLTGLLFVLTLFWHDWIEAFGIDPDNGSGGAEWLVVAVLFVLSAAFSSAARFEWRRAAGTALA